MLYNMHLQGPLTQYYTAHYPKPGGGFGLRNQLCICLVVFINVINMAIPNSGYTKLLHKKILPEMLSTAPTRTKP